MSSARDSDDEMKPSGLDDLTADRLLSGQVAALDAPPAYRLVADIVQKAAVPAPATDAARETATVAAMAEVLGAAAEVPAKGRRRSRFAGMLSAKAAAIGAVTLLGATAAAAATNSLPAPAQRAISAVASDIGLSIPKPASPKPSRDGTGAARALVGPGTTTTIAPSGLCVAYNASTSSRTTGHAADSVADPRLQQVAAAAGMSVADYCKHAVPASAGGSAGTTLENSVSSTTSTTEPSSPTTPVSTSHDNGPPVTTPQGHGPPVTTPGSSPPVTTPQGHGPPATTPGSSPPVTTQGSGPPVSTPHGNGPPTSVGKALTPGNSHRP